MGAIRDLQIAEFQRQAGIEPARERRAELIKEIKRKAVLLLEVLVLEEAGIRDGDGHWGGADPLEICDDLSRLYSKYRDPGVWDKREGEEEVTPF